MPRIERGKLRALHAHGDAGHDRVGDAVLRRYGRPVRLTSTMTMKPATTIAAKVSQPLSP